MEKRPGLDEISLPARGNSVSGQIKISVAAELMKNQTPASPIEPTENLAVVQDAAGRPMLFAIGSDRRLHLIRFDESGQSGWSATELMSGFVDYSVATTFAVSQDMTGRISVTLALAKGGGQSTDLFVASLLEPSSDWANFATLCAQVSGVDARFAGSKMLMGNSDDGEAPVTVVVGSIADEQYYYQVTGTAAVRCEFPQNVKAGNIQDLEIGYAFGQRGLFFLYKIGDGQSLVCKTLPTAEQGSLTHDYSPGPRLPKELQNLRYNCIATPTGSETDPFLISSDIFVGTDRGIFLFRDGRRSALQTVTEQLKDVHELLVTQDANSISIWATVSPNSIYYIYGQKGPTYTWHTPVLFSETAIHIAPMRSQKKRANELFIVGQDRSVTHHWQDRGSTLWQERLIQVPTGSEVIEYNSFTTQIQLADEQGRPLVDVPLRITASQWTYAEANGLIYSLDKDTPATIKTDRLGNLTLILAAPDLNVPIIHVESDCFAKTLNIYPNGQVQKGIAAIKSGRDLQAAKTADGKPVLTDSFDQATLDGVAANLSQLSLAAGDLGGPTGANNFVVVTERVRHDGSLRLDHLPANYAFGMAVDGGQWRLMDAPAALLAAPSVGDFFGDVRGFAGDLIREIERFFAKGIQLVRDGVTYLKDGVNFVIRKVEKGLLFVLNLADRVLNVLLDTLGAVFKVVNWLLKQIGIDLEKILAWLGNLFGWTDILETSDKIVDAVNSWLEGMVKAAPVMAKQVDSALQELQHQIADPEIVRRLGGAGESRASGGGFSIFQSPAANWPIYQIMHGRFFAEGVPELDQSTIEQIEGKLKGLMAKGLFTAESGARELLQAIVDGISSMSLGEMFKKILELFALMALGAVREASTAIFGLAAVLVQGLKKILNFSVKVPILSTVLRLLMGGRKLTFLRVLGILLAIPLRIAHVIATGSSLKNADLAMPAGFDLAALLQGGQGAAEPVLRATQMNEAMAVATMVGASDLGAPVQIPLAVMLTYSVARTVGLIFNDLGMVIYLETGEGNQLVSMLEVGFTAVALGMVGLNQYLVHEGGDPGPTTTAQIVGLSLSGLALLLKGVGLRRGWKPTAKSLSMAVYCIANVVLGVGFGKQEKTRATSLRFTGNFFLNLWSTVSSFPVRVGSPHAVAAIVGANSLAALTHISIVSARWATDREDRVQYTLS